MGALEDDMRQGRWVWTTGLALALGCAAPEPGSAQDAQPRADAADAAEAATPVFTATIKDRYLQEEWQLRDARLFVPEVSLFGGGGGEEAAAVTVKVGAAELEVPLARIARIDVGDQNEDELSVKITLRPAQGAPDAPPIEGTIRSSLELHGVFGATDLKATVRLREVSWVSLAPA